MMTEKHVDVDNVHDNLQRAEWRRFNMFTVAPMTFDEYRKTLGWYERFKTEGKMEKK